jgi:hypothetical protein
MTADAETIDWWERRTATTPMTTTVLPPVQC